jgi:hypothetical protein
VRLSCSRRGSFRPRTFRPQPRDLNLPRLRSFTASIGSFKSQSWTRHRSRGFEMPDLSRTTAIQEHRTRLPFICSLSWRIRLLVAVTSAVSRAGLEGSKSMSISNVSARVSMDRSRSVKIGQSGLFFDQVLANSMYLQLCDNLLAYLSGCPSLLQCSGRPSLSALDSSL